MLGKHAQSALTCLFMPLSNGGPSASHCWYPDDRKHVTFIGHLSVPRGFSQGLKANSIGMRSEPTVRIWDTGYEAMEHGCVG